MIRNCSYQSSCNKVLHWSFGNLDSHPPMAFFVRFGGFVPQGILRCWLAISRNPFEQDSRALSFQVWCCYTLLVALTFPFSQYRRSPHFVTFGSNGQSINTGIKNSKDFLVKPQNGSKSPVFEPFSMKCLKIRKH